MFLITVTYKNDFIEHICECQKLLSKKIKAIMYHSYFYLT